MLKFRIFFAFILFTAAGFSQLTASDYSIPEISVDVTITENGIVRISEHRTYHFEGDFSWADYRLPKQGFTHIKNIRVSEDGIDYINDNSEEENTFSVAESNREVVIKWHYSASDTSRTFSVSYDLEGAIASGPDWSEFYWNYLAAGRDKTTRDFQILLTLPEPVSQDSLYAWPRGADQIDIETEPGQFLIQAQEIPRNQSVTIRTLFPTWFFHDSASTLNEPSLSLEAVLDEEAQFARQQEEQALRDAFYASITPGVTLLITALSIALFIFFYQKYGRRYTTKTISTQTTVMLPDQTPPALVGKLMGHGYLTGHHLLATLFDLARRGWFTIHEEPPEEKSSWFSEDSTRFRLQRSGKIPEENVPEWEKMILNHAEKQLNDGKDTLDKLFDFSKTDSYKWFSNWKKEVKSVYDDQNWIDKKSYKGVILNAILQSILAIAAIFMAYLGTVFALVGIITASLMLAASAIILRRTKAGEEKFRRWKAYRDGLKKADQRTLRIKMLDLHFIYATALGLSEQQINQFFEQATDGSDFLIPWIVLTTSTSQSPATVASSLSTLAASGNTSFGGTSGGSGASVGSPGGGASGGAG